MLNLRRVVATINAVGTLYSLFTRSELRDYANAIGLPATLEKSKAEESVPLRLSSTDSTAAESVFGDEQEDVQFEVDAILKRLREEAMVQSDDEEEEQLANTFASTSSMASEKSTELRWRGSNITMNGEDFGDSDEDTDDEEQEDQQTLLGSAGGKDGLSRVIVECCTTHGWVSQIERTKRALWLYCGCSGIDYEQCLKGEEFLYNNFRVVQPDTNDIGMDKSGGPMSKTVTLLQTVLKVCVSLFALVHGQLGRLTFIIIIIYFLYPAFAPILNFGHEFSITVSTDPCPASSTSSDPALTS